MIPGNNKKFMQVQFPVSALHYPEKYTGRNRVLDIKSSYEFTFMRYLDNNTNVISYHYEEVPIQYASPIDQGRMHRYWVDFWMRYINVEGKESQSLVELKPFYETQKPPLREHQSDAVKKQLIETYLVNQAKFSAAFEYARRNSMRFTILTERELFYFPGFSAKYEK